MLDISRLRSLFGVMCPGYYVEICHIWQLVSYLANVGVGEAGCGWAVRVV